MSEIVDREYWEGLLAEAVRERENYNGMHQAACLEIERLRGLLLDAGLQIEYLHDKFRRTGTGEATLARIRSALSPAQRGDGDK